MKNQKLIITMLLLFTLVLGVSILSSSCDTTTDPICDTNISEFIPLYNNLSASDQYTLDIQTMEYTFSRSIGGNLCSIGYEGHPNLSGSSVYKIEIIENSTTNILYSATYTFTAGSKSYQALSSPINIAAGQLYTIRRTVINYGSSIGNTISHLKALPSTFTPITQGNITIHATKTYDQYSASTPYNIQNNQVLPCIDIIFEQ